MITRDQLIVIGRYNKPHGVDGEISATLDIDVSLLSHFSCLLSEIDGIIVPFFPTAQRAKSAKTVLLTIEDMDDEHAVSLLVNKDVFVLKSEFADLPTDEDTEEFPLDYFIGFSITDGDELVGEIVDVDNTTQNVLFIVRRPDESVVSVPAVDELVESIQEDKRTIKMNLPQGLLSL